MPNIQDVKGNIYLPMCRNSPCFVSIDIPMLQRQTSLARVLVYYGNIYTLEDYFHIEIGVCILFDVLCAVLLFHVSMQSSDI